MLNLITSCKQLIRCTVIPMTSSKSETTTDQSDPELSNLMQRRTGNVPTILWERLGVIGTMVVLQHFKSKEYENGMGYEIAI